MCTISSGFPNYPAKKGVLLSRCGRLYHGSKLFAALPTRGPRDPAHCHVICTARLRGKGDISAPMASGM